MQKSVMWKVNIKLWPNFFNDSKIGTNVNLVVLNFVQSLSEEIFKFHMYMCNYANPHSKYARSCYTNTKNIIILFTGVSVTGTSVLASGLLSITQPRISYSYT